jgi:hypothetical protein
MMPFRFFFSFFDLRFAQIASYSEAKFIKAKHISRELKHIWGNSWS